LRSRTNKLTQTIDETRSEITRVEANVNGELVKMQSSITQTAQSINSKVSKGDVVSEINQSADKISLKSNRISIDSTNLKISEDGKLESHEGKFYGDVYCYGTLYMFSKQYGLTYPIVQMAFETGDNQIIFNDIYGMPFMQWSEQNGLYAPEMRIQELNVGSIKTLSKQGVTGSFTSSDGKKVTITNGIITSIS
jgi:hypothetical protein